MKMRSQRGEKRGSHGRSRREKCGAHGEAQEVLRGTWEVTGSEKQARHMAGGSGEHRKTRCGAHERKPLFWSPQSLVVIGDPFISATIPAFVRFLYLDQVRASARSPLCAFWVTLLNPLENPTLVEDQLLGNSDEKELCSTPQLHPASGGLQT